MVVRPYALKLGANAFRFELNVKALGLGPWCDEVTEDTHGVSETWATVVTGEELEGLTYNEEVACALEVLCS